MRKRFVFAVSLFNHAMQVAKNSPFGETIMLQDIPKRVIHQKGDIPANCIGYFMQKIKIVSVFVINYKKQATQLPSRFGL